MKRVWAVLSDSDDLLAYEEAESAEAAIKAFAKKAGVPEKDAKLLYAVPGDRVRDDVEVPGWLIPAFLYGPEFAFGPKDIFPDDWEDYEVIANRLEERGIYFGDIAGWVRVDSIFDLWCPVVR